MAFEEMAGMRGGRDGRDCDVDGMGLGALLEDIVAQE